MNQSVDNVIDRLSEIEAKAVQISEVTESKIKALSDQMEQKKKAYEENLLRETADKVERFRYDMIHLKEKEIARLEAETEDTIREMQEKYEKQHDDIVDQIVRSIVKV